MFNLILIKSGFCGLEHIDTSEHPGLGDTGIITDAIANVHLCKVAIDKR